MLTPSSPHFSRSGFADQTNYFVAVLVHEMMNLIDSDLDGRNGCIDTPAWIKEGLAQFEGYKAIEEEEHRFGLHGALLVHRRRRDQLRGANPQQRPATDESPGLPEAAPPRRFAPVDHEFKHLHSLRRYLGLLYAPLHQRVESRFPVAGPVVPAPGADRRHVLELVEHHRLDGRKLRIDASGRRQVLRPPAQTGVDADQGSPFP